MSLCARKELTDKAQSRVQQAADRLSIRWFDGFFTRNKLLYNFTDDRAAPIARQVSQLYIKNVDASSVFFLLGALSAALPPSMTTHAIARCL